MSQSAPWWRNAVVYQVYLRSFADGNGDGVGDIAGLRSRLPYLASLGIDAIWVNPWYESPMNDGGYDVSDYRRINPMFGTLNEAQQLIDEAKAMGIRLLVDLVPNHTSSEHAWFRAALDAGPGSPERRRYHFLTGRGERGELPPNDWESVFGGPAWTRVPDGEWYLHLFDTTQPDLNWNHQEVRAEFEDLLRFWLDLGAAGFRVDVAHALVKHPDYPDIGARQHEEMLAVPEFEDHPHWDRPEVHEIVRQWRSVLDEYPETVMVAEAWLPDWASLAEYVRPGRYHQAFDFLFLQAPWEAKAVRDTIDEALTASVAVGSVPTWVLSNHDVVRHSTRYGLPIEVVAKQWLLEGDRSLLDQTRGLARARAATLLMLALPGSAYIYQGEELGLPEVHDLPEAALDDPVWERSGHSQKGRDGCRVPIPWSRDGPSLGFGEVGSWLPQPDGWSELSMEAQDGVPGSTLELYRDALRLRPDVFGDDESFEWVETREHLITFLRGGDVKVAVNYGEESVPLPAGEIILTSGPLGDGALPPDTAAWLRV